jgi:hypothetical protein
VHKIITLRHDDTSIAFDTTAATWSLTDLWRAAGSPHGKEVWRWMETEQAREYLDTLKRNLAKNEVSPDLVSDEVAIIITRRGGAGSGGGTWGHQLVGLEYARYLSPALSIACNQFLLDYWRGGHQTPDPRVAALEQRVAALEQARQPAQETLTITVSLDPSERINVMRDLGGIVTPSQLFAELRRRGQAVNYTSILQWLHQAAKRGELRRRHRGQYEVSDEDTPPANKEH